MGASSDILEELCAGDGWVPLQMDGAAMEHRRPNDVSQEKKNQGWEVLNMESKDLLSLLVSLTFRRLYFFTELEKLQI